MELFALSSFGSSRNLCCVSPLRASITAKEKMAAPTSYDLIAVAEGLEWQAARYANMCAFSRLGVSHRDITIQNVLASLEVAGVLRAMVKEAGGDRTGKVRKP